MAHRNCYFENYSQLKRARSIEHALNIGKMQWHKRKEGENRKQKGCTDRMNGKRRGEKKGICLIEAEVTNTFSWRDETEEMGKTTLVNSKNV